MSKPTYDPENIFAKILQGQIPCYKVFEDEATFAFLDIMPRAHGHTLVIPKAAARNILDIDDDDLAAVSRTVKRIAIAGKAAFKADGVSISQFNEAAGGQVVFHLHVHVIPRITGISMKPAASVMEDADVLKANREKLLAILNAN